jgi:glycosyltransferase involved in cell wall biosynthesis
VTEFLKPNECIAALQACDVIALPYRSTDDSSSGAVHLALSAQRPVLTTRVPVFSDVAEVVAQVRRATPRAIAGALSRLIDDPAEAARLVERGRTRIQTDAFSAVGRTYAKFVAATFADLSAFERPYPLDPEPVPAIGPST